MLLFTPVQLIGGSTAALVGLILSGLLLYRHQLKKVGPNKALIVYGKRGTTIIAGGAHFINPIVSPCAAMFTRTDVL